MGLYDYTVKDQNEKDVSLSDYKGKVLLIVNTSTGCGFTLQYQGLQDLYDKYGTSPNSLWTGKAILWLVTVPPKKPESIEEKISSLL